MTAGWARPAGARRVRLLGTLVALALAGAAAVAVAEDDGDKSREAGHAGRQRYARYDESDLQRARRAVGAMQRADPGLRRVFESAAGYAVLAEVGTSGGADGVGVLFEDGQAAGRVTLPRSPASLRADGLPYAEVILFGTRQAVAAFKQGGLNPEALVRAVAVADGATTKVQYLGGVSVLTMGRSGGAAGPVEVAQAFGYLPYHREISASSR